MVLRVIMPAGNQYANRIMSSFLAIVFIELLAQPMRLDADNIIALRIKVMRSAKHFRCDSVFFNFINSSCQGFLNYELEEIAHRISVRERLAL